MKVLAKFVAAGGRYFVSRAGVALIVLAECITFAKEKARSESIVVEQGNQIVRTGDIRVDPGEEVVVRNTGSRLELADILVVDGGTVRLESGGSLKTNATTGHSRLTGSGARAIIDGTDSTWTVGGYLEVAGESHLEISNGGKVRSGLAPGNRSHISGAEPGAPSTAMITGAGSIWQAGSDFAVGDSGEAHLVIRNGGTLQSGLDGHASRVLGSGALGEPGSSSTIIGAGSTWLTGGDLEISGTNEVRLAVGDSGKIVIGRGFAVGQNSTLIIDNGGKIESGRNGATSVISGGEASGRPTTVTVTGEDSSWISHGVLGADGGGSGVEVLVTNGGRIEGGLNGTRTHFFAGHSDSHVAPISVIVEGEGSLLKAHGALDAGYGEATLVIRDGGRVESGLNGGPSNISGFGPRVGTATITGPGSTWDARGPFYVSYGFGGESHLLVSDGGTLLTGRNGDESSIRGFSSTATVTGLGSRWITEGILRVGHFGESHLIVRDGGYVKSRYGLLQGMPGTNDKASTIVVEGADSTWLVEGELRIDGGNGASEGARFVIRNGGKVESGEAKFHGDIDSTRPRLSAVVTGTGSTWTIRGRFDAGNGSLEVLDGGTLMSGEHGITLVDDGGRATVAGANSIWAIHGDFQIGDRVRPINPVLVKVANGGLLRVDGNFVTFPQGTLELAHGRVESQQLNAAGDIRGTGTIQSGLTSEGATIVGNSTGLLTIAGDFTQTTTASLFLELAGRGGAAGADFDRLVVQGIATLDGFIDVSLLDGFQPRLGDTFELIRYGSMEFGDAGAAPPELRLPLLAPELTWHSEFAAQALTISVQAVPEPNSILLAFFGLLLGWGLLVAEKKR